MGNRKTVACNRDAVIFSRETVVGHRETVTRNRKPVMHHRDTVMYDCKTFARDRAAVYLQEGGQIPHRGIESALAGCCAEAGARVDFSSTGQWGCLPQA